MLTPLKGLSAMPATRIEAGRRPDVESDLTDKYHVGWKYIEGVNPNNFDLEKSQSNQARFEAINEGTVQEYKEAVERGDYFPAVVAYRPRKGGKLVIIDGNHRLAAHLAADEALDVYEVDSGTRAQTIQLMTYAFNTRHGRPTSEVERTTHALFLVENGASIAQAAAAVNVAVNTLKRAVARANADRRASEVGIDPREWESLAQSARSRLLNVSTDEGLKDAVHLAYAAKLDVNEIFELVALVNATQSATKQRAIIKAETQRHQERIQAGGGGVLTTTEKRAVSPKARLGMVIGQIAALPDDVVAVAKTYGEAERADITKSLTESIRRLTAVRTAINPKAR